MNLLLLLYAMVAGLTGFNAGPSTVARMAAVAETGSLAPAIDAPGQIAVAFKALAARAALVIVRPVAAMIDARRIAFAPSARPIAATGRVAPERRLE